MRCSPKTSPTTCPHSNKPPAPPVASSPASRHQRRRTPPQHPHDQRRTPLRGLAPDLAAAARTAARKAFVILDATLLPTDRIAADRPYFPPPEPERHGPVCQGIPSDNQRGRNHPGLPGGGGGKGVGSGRAQSGTGGAVRGLEKHRNETAGERTSGCGWPGGSEVIPRRTPSYWMHRLRPGCGAVTEGTAPAYCSRCGERVEA